MRKIMSLMLGLALLTGSATAAFGRTTTAKQKSKRKSGKKRARGTNSVHKRH